ncbi:hypothetical protein Dimus_031424 [Dionaea muscipula]
MSFSAQEGAHNDRIPKRPKDQGFEDTFFRPSRRDTPMGPGNVGKGHTKACRRSRYRREHTHRKPSCKNEKAHHYLPSHSLTNTLPMQETEHTDNVQVEAEEHNIMALLQIEEEEDDVIIEDAATAVRNEEIPHPLSHSPPRIPSPPRTSALTPSNDTEGGETEGTTLRGEQMAPLENVAAQTGNEEVNPDGTQVERPSTLHANATTPVIGTNTQAVATQTSIND